MLPGTGVPLVERRAIENRARGKSCHGLHDDPVTLTGPGQPNEICVIPPRTPVVRAVAPGLPAASPAAAHDHCKGNCLHRSSPYPPTGNTEPCPPARSKQASRPTPRTSSSRFSSTKREQEAPQRTHARSSAASLSVLIIGGVFVFALPKIANYGDVWDVVQTLSWEWLVAARPRDVLNLATYAPPLMAALPGLSYLHASRVHARVDGALDGRSGRRSRRHGDVLRDAARVGLQRPPGRARRDRHRCLEPVHHPRLPDPRRRGRRRRRRIAIARSRSSR